MTSVVETHRRTSGQWSMFGRLQLTFGDSTLVSTALAAGISARMSTVIWLLRTRT